MPSLITIGHGVYLELGWSLFKLSAQRDKICTLGRLYQLVFGLSDVNGRPRTCRLSTV
jgi:hypothetical protein